MGYCPLFQRLGTPGTAGPGLHPSHCFCLSPYLQRHPAGGVPGWPRALAGCVLRLQPLSILWLLLGRPAVHPSLPASTAAHPPQGTPNWLSVDGGRPALPEGPWSLVTLCQLEEDSTGKAIFASGFLCMLRRFCDPFPFCYNETH